MIFFSSLFNAKASMDCKGCHSGRSSGEGLVDGYHPGCKPCKGCKESRPESVLIGGYHFNCILVDDDVLPDHYDTRTHPKVEWVKTS